MPRLARVIAVLAAVVITLAVGAGPAAAASDRQIAAAGVIVASDLPATWVASPPDISGDKEALARAAKTPGCTDYVRFARANQGTTKAASASYTLDDQLISNKSYVYQQPAGADRTMVAISAPTVGGCLGRVFEQTIGAQLETNKRQQRVITGVNVIIAPVDFQAVGDDTVAFDGTVTITLKDKSTQELLVGLLVVRIDRVVTTYSLSTPPAAAAVQTPFADAVSATLVRTAQALQEQ